MFYPFPKKIQYQPSQAKWSVQSTHSVLLIVGLDELRQQIRWTESQLAEQIDQLCKKAQSLDIPIIFLSQSEPQHGMMQLGQYLSVADAQLMVAGKMSPMMKQMIQHASSMIEKICVMDDAVLTTTAEQHIQSVDVWTEQGIHYMNTATLTRLWPLSAPKELILSDRGILLAVAEQLDLAPLDINPEADLRDYGLDSVAMVTLIGLCRANGANITYEAFLTHCTLEKLVETLKK